jgi:hypothetical protein
MTLAIRCNRAVAIVCSLTVVTFLALSAASYASDRKDFTWRTMTDCKSTAPGQGMFTARVKEFSDRTYDGVYVTGCGKNSRFRKRLDVSSTDPWHVSFHAVPFFKAGSYDFIIGVEADDSVSYSLLSAQSGYTEALSFDAIEDLYFADSDGDGRWEILAYQVASFKCANGATPPDGETGWGYPKILDAKWTCKK